MVDQSRNPNEAKTQTHSTRNSRLIRAKVAKVDQTHSSAAAAKVDRSLLQLYKKH